MATHIQLMKNSDSTYNGEEIHNVTDILSESVLDSQKNFVQDDFFDSPKTDETAFDKVKNFCKSFGSVCPDTPGLPDAGIRKLRRKLLREEFNEYLDAEEDNDLVEIADAISDIVYIALGSAAIYGIPFDKVFNHVHDTNMAKLGPDGIPMRRADGKILKPEGWQPPNIKKILGIQ
jgi:predicted HAD superfamily Cof-like phosphohydrolase